MIELVVVNRVQSSSIAVYISELWTLDLVFIFTFFTFKLRQESVILCDGHICYTVEVNIYYQRHKERMEINTIKGQK